MTQSPPPDSSSPPAGSPFSPDDALQFMQRMWNPFGVPLPGFPLPGTAAAGTAPPAMGMGFPNPATMFATLDPAEIERKIGELKVIQNWLQMSLNLIEMSVKTLELQKTALEALRASHAPAHPRSESGQKK